MKLEIFMLVNITKKVNFLGITTQHNQIKEYNNNDISHFKY